MWEPGDEGRFHGAQGGRSRAPAALSHSLVLARIYPHQLQVKRVDIVALEEDGHRCCPEHHLQSHWHRCPSGPEHGPSTVACSPLAAATPSFLTLGLGQASPTLWELPVFSRNTVGPPDSLCCKPLRLLLPGDWRPIAEADACSSCTCLHSLALSICCSAATPS